MKKDIIAELTGDHRKVESLFRRYRALPRAGGVARKRKIFDEVRRELSMHAGAEEQVLYPAVREAFRGGEKRANSGIEEHSAVKTTLAELQGMDPAARDFDRKLATLAREVRHHVAEEERQIFPRLRKSTPRTELVQLGARLRSAKRLAPTRPHPLAPATPPANYVTDVIAGAVDRLRDALMALTEAPPRSAPAALRRKPGRAKAARTRSRKRRAATAATRTGRARSTPRKRPKVAKAGAASRAKRKSSRRRRSR